MFKKTVLSILVLATLFLASCVSRKKYSSANDEIAKVSAQNQELKQQVNDLNGQHQTLSAEYSNYKTTCEANQKQLAAYESAVKELQNNLEALKKAIEGAVADFEGQGLEVI